MASKPTKVLIVAHSVVMYTGSAEVVYNIFRPFLNQAVPQLDIRQIGLLHTSAVRQCPWPIIPTKTINHGENQSFDPRDLEGEITIDREIREWKPDLIFIFNDPAQAIRQLNVIARRCRTIVYVTIDGSPVPRVIKGLLLADRLITMSSFSRRTFIEAVGSDGNRMEVSPACIDLSRYPVRERRRVSGDGRESLPTQFDSDSFILGWVGRNQWRKQFWINLQLIGILRHGKYVECESCGRVRAPGMRQLCCSLCGSRSAKNGSPNPHIRLWVHIPTGKEIGDWNLEELSSYYGLEEGLDVFYTEGCGPNAHIAPTEMSRLYECFDILLMLSGGEGFGLPIFEAMASGIPIIASDYSSHAEWVERADSGIRVSGILQPEARTGIMRHISDVYEAADAVLKLYRDPGLYRAYCEKGRSFVEAHAIENHHPFWADVIGCASQQPVKVRREKVRDSSG